MMMVMSAELPPAPEEERPPGTAKLPKELRCLGPVRILVLDDDPSMCTFLKEVLQVDQLTVDTSSAVDQFEACLQAKPYHLIILDYVIPGLTAEQLFKWIQAHQPEAGTMVITGYPTMDSALSSLRAHSFDYLTKPFSVAQVQEVVQRYLLSKGLLGLSEDSLREALGQVIREQRKARGLTLAQLAERSGVSLGYLSQIELGKNAASMETLYRVALGLGSRLAELFQQLDEQRREKHD